VAGSRRSTSSPTPTSCAGRASSGCCLQPASAAGAPAPAHEEGIR
jgi:hypothetical protein